jgi:hypothetical protein
METTTEQPQTEPVALGLNDLNSMLTIIEVCSTRGSFRAEELAAVGALFNKIRAFVQSNAPAETEASSQTLEIKNA